MDLELGVDALGDFSSEGGQQVRGHRVLINLR
jgi:hypothetical protein